MNADAFIHSLISRLGNKISSNYGHRIENIEVDPLVQQTVRSLVDLSQYKVETTSYSLLGLLETNSKNYSGEDPYGSDVLYSQLFLLRIIAACLNRHWQSCRETSVASISTRVASPHVDTFDKALTVGTDSDASSLRSNTAVTDNIPLAPLCLPSKGFSSPTSPTGEVASLQTLEDPPPLADSLANYMLKLIFHFLNQTSSNDGFQESAYMNAHSKGSGSQRSFSLRTYSRAIADLKSGIQQATGQMLFYLSASNWPTVFHRIRSRISFLAGTNDESVELGELRFLEWCNLDEKRLSMVLQELNVAFLQFKRSIQLSMAIVLRKAIWNWIEVYPLKFISLCQNQKRLEGGPEILFDMCNSLADNGRRKAVFWPLQVMLLILCPDILLAITSDEGNASKKAQFFDTLKKALKSTRLAEVAAVSYVDICKASTYVSNLEVAALRYIVPDIESELKEKLFDPQTPFLNAEGVIDQKLMTDCLTAFFRLNASNTMHSLIPICLSETAPISFRLALVKSCFIISAESYLPWNPTLSSMHSTLAAPLRELFLNNLVYDRKDPKKSISIDKKARKQQQSQANENNEKLEILMNILRVYRSDPMLAVVGHTAETQHEGNSQLLHNITLCLHDPNLIIRTCAAEALLELYNPPLIEQWGTSSSMMVSFWKISSTVLIDIARQILDYKDRDDGVRYFVEVLLQVLIHRNEFLQLHKEEVHLGLNIQERLTSLVAIEIALLVLLCSPDADVCSMSTACFGQLCIEAEITEEYEESETNQLTIFKNIDVYKELAQAGVLITGRVAQQKSIRKTLRRIHRQTPGNLAAWEEVYKRWRVLKSYAIRPPEDIANDQTDVPKKKNNFFSSNKHNHSQQQQQQQTISSDNKEDLSEWLNYTGFLCALGGCCLVSEDRLQSSSSDWNSPRSNKVVNMEIYGQSKFSTKSMDSNQLMNRFIMEMVELLICESALTRETVKEILGSELNPALHEKLFQHFESIIGRFFNSDGGVTCNDNYTMFVEQAILVFKLILDRLQESVDFILATDLDIGNLILFFTKYLNNLGYNNIALRIKIKMCQLIEILMNKRDLFNFYQEFQYRNKVLEIIVEWTSDFSVKKSDSTHSSHDDQNEKLHRDLDQACMKAIVLLLEGLPLQPNESKNENDSPETKSRLFYKYFSYFIKLLNRCRILENIEIGSNSFKENIDLQTLLSKSKESCKDLGPLKDYTILALSNLLSANIETGLKYSLSMGYHEDTKTRSAFMQVLTNILKQGTEFESLAENSIKDKFDKIIALLTEPDLSLSTSLCEVCPVHDVDELATVMLHVFDSRHMTMPLLKAVIEKEINKTESSPELFRRNSIASRLLASFAKLYGDEYLHKTLQPILLEMTTNSRSYEMDPSKIGPQSNANHNLANLKKMCQTFLDAILASFDQVPTSIRRICHYLSSVVFKKFPEASTTAVGGLMFLRFICPAIVAPDIHGLVKTITDQEIKRGLLLITKVIQNLANKILFGSKESFMISLNDLLESYIPKVTNFLQEISSPLPEDVDSDTCIISDLEETDLNRLHHYLLENIERIGRHIASQNQSNPYPITNPIISPTEMETRRSAAKLAYYKLSTLLAQLGPPVDVLKKKDGANVGTFQKSTGGNQVYRDFMDRNRHRNTSVIKDKKIFYEGGVSKEKRPVFYLIARRFVPEVVDLDLVLLHIFQTLEPYFGKSYELVLDITQFGPNNEIAAQYANFIPHLIPNELYQGLSALYFYNVNNAFYKYTKLLGRHLTHKVLKRTSCPCNLSELYDYIQPSEVRLPKATISLETDNGVIFSPVTCVTQARQQFPCIMKIFHETIQITMLKKQEIMGVSCYFNDVYHISEIDEITKGSFRDDSCLVIKYEQGNSSMSLISPKIDLLYKAITSAKARFQLTRPSNITERLIRPNNVPGTLLNMALLNLGSEDSNLRLAAYNLLFALIATFNFDVGNHLLIAKDLCIPTNNTSFVLAISEKLAVSEPLLTYEFLTECFVGFRNSTTPLKHLCLAYMTPWLSNLVYLSRHSSQEGGEPHAKTRELLKMLFHLTVKEVEMAPSIQSKIWQTIAKEDELMDLVLDCLVKCACEHGIGSNQTEILADTIVTLSSVNVRAGKLISRLRKLLVKTSAQPKRSLTEHQTWTEIAVLIRFNLMISFNNQFITQHYLPELFHVISILVAIGSPLIRSSIHGLVINVIQSLCTCIPTHHSNLKPLSMLLAEFSEPKYRLLFGLNRSSNVNAFTRGIDTNAVIGKENMSLSGLESIVHTLLDVMTYGSADMDQSNIWRARWMSLVTSNAFQFNPAVQPRAFVVLGCLARGEVDDDLLYQILVSLRRALEIFDEKDCNLMSSILLCLSNIAENLPDDSRFLLPMFWLSIAFTQIGHLPLFSAGINLLEVVIRKVKSHGSLFLEKDPCSVLMEARQPFQSVSNQLDAYTGVRFSVDFPFAFAAILIKGFKHPSTKTTTHNVFTSMLDLIVKCSSRQTQITPQISGFLAPLLPIAARNGELRELFLSVGLDEVSLDNSELNISYYRIFDCFGVPDHTTAVLLVSLMMGLLQHAEFESEYLFLYAFFAEAALAVPEVFTLFQDRLIPKMNQVLNSNQTAAIIDAVQSILYTVISNPFFKKNQSSSQDISRYLNELGFRSLLDCASFPKYTREQLLTHAGLVSLLIENIIGQ